MHEGKQLGDWVVFFFLFFFYALDQYKPMNDATAPHEGATTRW